MVVFQCGTTTYTRLKPNEDDMTRHPFIQNNLRYKYTIYNLYVTKRVSLSELSDGWGRRDQPQ